MCKIYSRIEAISLTQFYLVIADLAEQGQLLQLYTQNIDRIDMQLVSLKTLIPLPKKKP